MPSSFGRFLLYVPEGVCVINVWKMRGLGRDRREPMLYILFVEIWWGFSVYGFTYILVFMLLSSLIICCNAPLDRDFICHCGILWQQALKWRSGHKVCIRDQALWKEVCRKDWAEGKFKPMQEYQALGQPCREFRSQHCLSRCPA